MLFQTVNKKQGVVLAGASMAFVQALGVGSMAHAEIITTAAHGDDWTIHRTDSTTENRILVKNSSNEPNDRVGVVQMNNFSFGEAVTAASVRFDIERTASGNNFAAGESISLWGVPDGDANEAFTQSLAWSSNPFITSGDADGTENNVTDAALVYLGSLSFPAGSSGDVLDFAGSAVTAFVQGDTNNLLTFLLTAEGQTNAANTVLLYNEDSSPIASEFYPSVMTNADAVVPEPAAMVLLGMGGLVAMRRRRLA